MPPSIIDLTEPSSPAPTESEIVPVAVLLEQAMVQADGDRLRRTLLAMCDASPEVVRIVGSLLLIPRKEKVVGGGSKTNAKGYSNVETDQNHKETSESSHTAGLAAKGIKRMRTRYPICSRCDEEFDVTNNKKESCRWHSGEVEDIDHLYWLSLDERYDEGFDIDEHREKHPEGFLYDCCGQCGGSEGCRRGRHVR